jgi:polysaccharide export outer membrane protein
MGEVVNQGTYQINENFINIYESLALGGGLTEYADRKKVILLRNDNNKLMYYKLDLTTSKISTSPLYYILPNDIIIVEPLRARSFNYQNSMITTFLGALTAILSIFYISSITRSNPQ